MDVIGNWKKVLFENYANFSGRARRAEFWSFALVNFGIYIVLLVLTRAASIFFILYVLFALAVIIPSIAVAIRRLHDTGKSGWMLLLGLIPLLGAILLLVFYFSDSSRGTNQYGPSEKYPDAPMMAPPGGFPPPPPQ